MVEITCLIFHIFLATSGLEKAERNVKKETDKKKNNSWGRLKYTPERNMWKVRKKLM